MNTRLFLPIPLAMALALASCTASQSLVQHDDDVYYLPSQAEARMVAPAVPEAQAEQPKGEGRRDDYYDPDVSQRLGAQRGYYDLAYNDPYYYNYSRFGFGMGWQSGWNGPGWGMGFGWGDPWVGAGYGWGQPWPTWHWAFDRPYYYSPYTFYSGYIPGYSGWGWDGWSYYGNYWSPYGPCRTCYTGTDWSSSRVIVGHRPSANGGSSGSSSISRPRLARDAGSLMPGLRPRTPVNVEQQQPQRAPSAPPQRTHTRSGESKPQQPSIGTRPGGRGTQEAPARERQPMMNRSSEGMMERSAPAPRSGGGEGINRHR